jgi:predicted CDP-diglyceride synthetase/phosphatidate cytidylyltransferase
MQLYSGFQNVILLALGAAALACELFAFVDGLRHPEAAYTAAGKRTRTFWLLVLGVALAIGFVTLFNPLSIFGLVAFVGAAVYLADVRPALRQVRGLGGRSTNGW